MSTRYAMMWKLCIFLILIPLLVYAAPWVTEGSDGCVPQFVKYKTDGNDTFAIGSGGYYWSPYLGIEADNPKTSSDATLAACFVWEADNGQLEIQYVCEDRYFDVKINSNGYVASANAASIWRVDLAEDDASAAFNISDIFKGSVYEYSAYTNDPGVANGRMQLLWHNRIMLTEDNYYGILHYWNGLVFSTYQPLDGSFISFTTDDCARGDV